MRLALLVAAAMLAFAANSVLNRAAVAGGTDPLVFGAVRVLSGAALLVALVAWRGRLRLRAPGRATGVAALTIYVFGFSAAYRGLDAGLGALVLFGTVQVTMFAGALLAGERPGPLRWAGTAIALAGLMILLRPAGAAPSAVHAGLMIAAGIGWGIYSLRGRGAADPLAETAANFALAAPVALLVWAVRPDWPTVEGLGLAVLSGAVASGLGYALWYAVLPRLRATSAAVSQLTVPLLAAAGGVALLGEPVTARLAVSAVLVLGGLLLSLSPRRHGG